MRNVELPNYKCVFKKDFFGFIDRIDTQCTINTILSTCDIKSLCTNIKHDVFYKAIKYWIDKFHNDIPLF